MDLKTNAILAGVGVNSAWYEGGSHIPDLIVGTIYCDNGYAGFDSDLARDATLVHWSRRIYL